MFSMLSRVVFHQNLAYFVKQIQALISNDTGFKLFTFNQVIDEINCLEQPVVTSYGKFCKSNTLKVRNARGLLLLS